MAFIKKIQQLDNGISADYWRVIGLHVDISANIARFVLGGYASKELRDAGGVPNSSREYNINPAQLAKILTPEIYALVAGAIYGHIGTEPRAIPQGALFGPETGAVTIPQTGEVISKDGVTLYEGQPAAIVSEFANAVFG